MPFLKDDEFLLLMNPNIHVSTNWGSPKPLYIPTVEDRIRYRSAGIQTAVERLIWKVIEPGRGQYNFSQVEEILRWNREADQKTIFHIYTGVMPEWMPEDWFARYDDGEIVYIGEMLSLWNDEVQEYIRTYCRLLINTFSAPDVLFIHGGYMEGEAIMPVRPAFYDQAALSNYRSLYGEQATPDIATEETKAWLKGAVIRYSLDMSKILYPQHRELWNMQQLLLNRWSPATGNFAQTDVLREYKKEFPDAHLTLLQYTYYDEAHGHWNELYVDEIKNEFECDVIVEAHFCKGLATTTPRSIAKGFRGQILCPTHPQGGEHITKGWMFPRVAAAHNLWKESRRL